MAVKTTEKRQFQKLTLKRALKVQVIILDRFDLERGHYCSQKITNLQHMVVFLIVIDDILNF